MITSFTMQEHHQRNVWKTQVFVASFILVFISCEKMLNYNYQGESIVSSATIHGTVYNVFTDEPVADAEIEMGINRTVSDGFGEFLILYILGDDENRDKPVSVTIHATNYFPYTDTLVLYPTDTEYNPRLVYAAPIIEQSAMSDYDDELVCQVKIKDYQGIGNITSVRGQFLYLKGNANDYRIIIEDLEMVRQISETEANYQIFLPVELDGGWVFESRRRYIIRAEDADGFHHQVEYYFSGTLLFPPL